MSLSTQKSWSWSRSRMAGSVRRDQPLTSEYSRVSTSSSSEEGEGMLGDEEKSSEDTNIPIPSHDCQHHFSRKTIICLIGLAILLSTLCSAALVSTAGFTYFRPTSTLAQSEQNELTSPFRPVPRLRHCGTSAEEARSLGCKFQIWSYSWVPPECYDAELVQDWLDMRDWEYYDDRYARGKVVNFTTEVLTGERLLYSTWGQHYWHCAFTWRKFLRAALGSGVGITDQDLDYHHANHCQDTIRNKPDYRPWDENDIELTVGFHSC